MSGLFNRYSISILSVTFLILFGSYAVTDEGYLYCSGDKSYDRDHPTTVVNPNHIGLQMMKEKRSDFVQKGKATVSWCGSGQLPTLNNNQYLILPTVEPGKLGMVFKTPKEESLEIRRWIKKDTFEANYESIVRTGGKFAEFTALE